MILEGERVRDLGGAADTAPRLLYQRRPNVAGNDASTVLRETLAEVAQPTTHIEGRAALETFLRQELASQHFHPPPGIVPGRAPCLAEGEPLVAELLMGEIPLHSDLS
jgi:hypothetical protein